MPRKTRGAAFDLQRDTTADSPTPPPGADPQPEAGAEADPPMGGQDRGPHALPALPELPPLPGPTALQSVPPAVSKPASPPLVSQTPRGSGGRPPSPIPQHEGNDGEAPVEPGQQRITKIPARVPADLYDQALHLVTGIGRPSWGQLVAWTCQDHHDQVLELLTRPREDTAARQPRGQNRQGTAALQVTARLTPDELAVVQDLIATAAAITQATITRTNLVIAALTVATRLAPGRPLD